MKSLLLQSEPQSQRLISPMLQISLLVGVTVHLVGFFIFRVNTSELPSNQPAPAWIQYVSPVSLADDLALQEQSELMDSAPLFIPTRWNASQEVGLQSRARFSQRFPPFEPQIDLFGALKPEGLRVGFTAAIESPSDLLALRYWPIFKAFAASEPKPVPYPDATVIAEILRLDRSEDGAMPVELEFDGEALQSTGAERPVNFLLRVSGDGTLVGMPALVESSGSDVFDRAVAIWLQRGETLGFQQPGYFTVRVYPEM
ncbi:MAG: hypothetical protein ACI81V_000410 [Lentimonas sp.]|jgi:hypothetical protein